MKRAQVSIEFILLGVMAFFFIFVVIGAILTLSADKQTENTFAKLDDLGRSIQQELLLASRMQDGYTRFFTLPKTIDSMQYSLVLGNSSPSNGYLSIIFSNQEIYYPTPVVSGTLVKGENKLRKENGGLVLN